MYESYSADVDRQAETPPAPGRRPPGSSSFNTTEQCLHTAQTAAERHRVKTGRKARRFKKLEDAKKQVETRLNYERRRLAGKGLAVVDLVLVDRVIASVEGCSVIVYMCPSGHVSTYPRRCKRRKICPVCAANRADQDVKRFTDVADRMRSPKLLTLTVGRCPFGKLAKWTKLLVESFAKLRRQSVFKRVRGGLWALEVVPKADGYHVHLHALVEGYIENRNIYGRPLETAWAKLTPWSSSEKRRSVDIRRADAGAIRETLKYAVKACPGAGKKKSVEFTDEWPALLEIITALHGKKVADVWGTFRELADQLADQAKLQDGDSLDDHFDRPVWDSWKHHWACPVPACGKPVHVTSWAEIADDAPP